MLKQLIPAALIAALPLPVSGAAVRDARITVVWSSGACDVTSRFVVDTAAPAVVEHHVLLDDDRRAPAFAVVGALAGQEVVAGRTVRVPISVTGAGRNEYTVRHRASARDRCPLIVPALPTDGLNRAVSIEVGVPAGATRLPGAFPAFTWNGPQGRATLGHIPSFVRVPHAGPETPPAWRDRFDLRRAIDIAALASIGIGTLGWLMLRKRA